MSLAAPSPLPLSARFASLSRRERFSLAGGAAAVAAFGLWLSSEAEAPPPAAPAVAALPVAPPPPLPQAPAPVAPAAAAPSLPSGLTLSGVMGSGAIFGFADGRQRAVPIGREVAPGLALKSVGIGHAIVGGPGGDLRVELNRFGATSAGVPVAVAAASSPAAGAASSEALHKRETTAFRLGLAPVAGSRGGGYAIRPGARIPHLSRAGLQPGDVIVRVNGSAFDEERLTELSWEIANASTTEIEFLRAGRRMKAALPRQ